MTDTMISLIRHILFYAVFPMILLTHKNRNKMAGLSPPEVAEARHHGVVVFQCINVICMVQLHGQVVRVMMYLSVATEE